MTYGQLYSETTSKIFSSIHPALISLTISTPKSRQLLATSDLKVSIDNTKSGYFFFKNLIVGTTLLISSSILMSFAPGLEL